ncbi:MerR family transcriptional regulator [Streptomyces kanamyceticus]|uniref:MerR family transcriptional regulator n=1 Tax=Streptomyces kanamyceticus TaxID=1967 RepID=UPI0037DC92E2
MPLGQGQQGPAWSTGQLAELAGTTTKTVRHYHETGLLDEPERAPNGYKRYGVSHLVRLRPGRTSGTRTPNLRRTSYSGSECGGNWQPSWRTGPRSTCPRTSGRSPATCPRPSGPCCGRDLPRAGTAVAESLVAHALVEFYNRAHLDVLQRVHAVLFEDDTAESDSNDARG